MIPIQVRLPDKLVEKIDGLVERGFYANRSDAIREGARHVVLSHYRLVKKR